MVKLSPERLLFIDACSVAKSLEYCQISICGRGCYDGPPWDDGISNDRTSLDVSQGRRLTTSRELLELYKLALI